MGNTHGKFINAWLINLIEEHGLEKNASLGIRLSELSAIKTGGTCSCLLTFNEREKLCRFLKGFSVLDNKHTALLPVGHATNILFNDGYLEIVLVKLGADFNYLDFSGDGIIRAGAALNLQKFVMECAKQGYDFSFLAGIPGTLGGAVAGNSGSAGLGINNMVKRIKYISYCSNSAVNCEKELLHSDYSYRKLNIPGLFIITDVFFEVSFQNRGNFVKNFYPPGKETSGAPLKRKTIFDKIRQNIKIKKTTQPLNTRNAGCFFKNPSGSTVPAGKLIDSCGLKGFNFGGAQVSGVHANFIINTGRASSKDIYTLSAIIKDAVMQKFGIELDYEVKLAGF